MFSVLALRVVQVAALLGALAVLGAPLIVLGKLLGLLP